LTRVFAIEECVWQIYLCDAARKTPHPYETTNFDGEGAEFRK
jgi:hypothetical protein